MTNKIYQIIAENKLETPFDIVVENFYYNGTVKRDAVTISDISMLDSIVEALLKKFGANPFKDIACSVFYIDDIQNEKRHIIMKERSDKPGTLRDLQDDE